MSLFVDLSDRLTEEEKRLLSRQTEGEPNPFDWQRLWTTKGVGMKKTVCQCLRTYLERAGDGCTGEIQKFRHSTFVRALEIEMRNRISSYVASLKAETHQSEDWEHDAYVHEGPWWTTVKAETHQFEDWEHDAYARKGPWWTEGMLYQSKLLTHLLADIRISKYSLGLQTFSKDRGAFKD
jgi:hypothetical protein